MQKGHGQSSHADQKGGRRSLDGDREAFQALVAPHLVELRQAASREIRYREAIGDLAPDDLGADELVTETLARAWRDRHRRPALLAIRPWLLGLLFRVADHIVRREARQRALADVRLEAPVPEQPIYDDEESFWEWYQPDEQVRWEDVIASPEPTPELEAIVKEPAALARLSPLAHRVLVLHVVHRLALAEVAAGLGIAPDEVSRHLAEAHDLAARERVAGKGEPVPGPYPSDRARSMKARNAGSSA